MSRSLPQPFLAFICLAATAGGLSACQSREFHEGSQDGADDQNVKGRTPPAVVECEVIVAGGSTAALSAALTAAREGAKTCLIEPTDWPGGQLTASAVSAIDFPHYKVNGINIGVESRKSVNLAKTFHDWVNLVDDGTVSCWVTNQGCFEPRNLLARAIEPAIAAEKKNLRVFRNTVVKRVTVKDRRVDSVTGIFRSPLKGHGYDDFLSKTISDWYSPRDSAHFRKKTVEFKGPKSGYPVFIDATEFGDVMVLAGASFLQGIETADGALETTPGYDKAGQATVFPFVMSYNTADENEGENPFPVQHPKFYGLGSRADWDVVWRYRRIRGAHPKAAPGDLSLQNWNPGNDYPYGYVFKSRADTLAERVDWQGGLDLATIAGAERHAYGWYYYLKNHPKNPRPNAISLDRFVLGTRTGLSKLPYLRDTRRSIGIGDFILTHSDISGPELNVTGTRFEDRIGIGAYVVDLHSVYTLPMPRYLNNIATLPYFLPFRALTNRDFDNLLVAGKTMAQSYLANAAIRLQPPEWHSGVGAGVAAAHMARLKRSSTLALQNISEIQARVKRHAPIDWTIGGNRYP